jgi:Protein of unknown function (DUF3570)
MKKLSLTVIGLYALFLHAFSQFNAQDTVIYKTKPLALEEVNLVSSYYSQNGNHSAITGGIGDEHVVDFANGLDLKFVAWDQSHNKHSITAGLGFDHHTSASSAYVSSTGASKTGGTRVYPSLDWTVENDKGNTFGFGAYFSTEYNYQSIGLDFHFSKKFSSNSEFNAKVSGYFDKVKLIYPSELIPKAAVVSTTPTYYTTASGRTYLSGGGGYGGEDNVIPSSPRNTFTASLSYAQVINTSLQASLMLDVVTQSGYLGLPFHRVYFNDGTGHVENLPSSRFKLPIGFRLNAFVSDQVVIRSYFRYYQDDWGINSKTADIEIPIKVSQFFSVSPFYRYYTQTASKYFGAYKAHTAADEFYSSNYSLSELTSHFVGLGIHTAPPKGVMNNEHFSSLDIRYGHYTQSTDLNSNIVTFDFTFK